MAPASGSSRFAPLNLNKSYGQQTASVSPAGPGFSPGANRTRVSSSHGGLPSLSRSRSQSLSSNSSSAAPPAFRASKLAVPRPVNLPSLRREHSGNDPTVALVGGSGSSGWTKLQPPSQSMDITSGQLGVSSNSTTVGSIALTRESTWGAPASQESGVSAFDNNQNAEGTRLTYQASRGRPAVYAPPGSRNARTNGDFEYKPPSPVLVQKAVVFRGDDFPTLQAASPSPAGYPEQHRRSLQQKQQTKQHELKEQQKKIQQSSEQENARELKRLEPVQPMRSQEKSTLHSKEELRLHANFRGQANGGSARADSISYGPSPLVRLNRVSNWEDDERETLHQLQPRRSDLSSEWKDHGRSQAGHLAPHEWAVDPVSDVDLLHSLSRNGSLAGSTGRDSGGNGNFPYKGQYAQSDDTNNGISRESQINRMPARKDNIDKWNAGFAKNDVLKRGWSFPAKEFNPTRQEMNSGNIAMKFGNSSSRSNREVHEIRGNGHVSYENDRMLRVVKTPQQASGSGWDTSRREPVTRDALRHDGSFTKESFPRNRGMDGIRGWQQGDRNGRVGANGSYYSGNEVYGYNNVRSSVRGRVEPTGLDYGKDKRANVFYSQPIMDDPFLGVVMDTRPDSSANGLEGFLGALGLDGKVVRRRKDEVKVSEFRDTARESFEAELERVLNMQELERKRVIEDRELAIELAKKEQEVQERLAREEEELCLKLEQEAREAATRAQWEADEAARKLEEERQTRELEKRNFILEEERRKEAARKKLSELEERIAQRESEKRREEGTKHDGTGSLGRPSTDRESMKRNIDTDWEDEDRYMPSLSKGKEESYEGPIVRTGRLLRSPSKGKELLELQYSGLKHSESPMQSLDRKGGQSVATSKPRSLPAWRPENVGNGQGIDSASIKYYSSKDNSHLNWDREHRNTLFPSDVSHASSRYAPATYHQDKMQTDTNASRTLYSLEQGLALSDDMRLSAKSFPLVIDGGRVDNTSERDMEDGWWGRDIRHGLHEKQSMRFPPVQSHVHGSDLSEYPSYGRLRQSLPKPPRVPPPPSRPLQHRKAFLSEDAHHVAVDLENTKVAHNNITQDTKHNNLSDIELTDKDHSGRGLTGLQPQPTVAEDILPLSPDDADSHVDVNSEVGSIIETPQKGCEQGSSLDNISEPCTGSDEDIPDAKLPLEGQEPDERQWNDEENPEVEESNVVEESWEPELDESSGIHTFLQMQISVNSDLGDTEIKSLLVDNESATSINDASGCAKDDDEVVNQTITDRFEGGILEEPCKPMQSQSEDSSESTLEELQKGDTVVNDQAIFTAAVQDLEVKPVPQQSSYLPGEPVESIQVGSLETLSSIQSVVPQFQQPFSFMALPISHSFTSNNVLAHPSVLPSTQGLQNQQELPFQLQLGVLPGAPLMPNAIQIGSIQMPLHIHTQIPQLHMHGQQPPFFQFGQISHVSLSQQLPSIPQQVQIHHTAGQPALSQADHLNSSNLSKESSYSNNVLKAGIAVANSVSVERAGDEQSVCVSDTPGASLEQKNVVLRTCHDLPASELTSSDQSEQVIPTSCSMATSETSQPDQSSFMRSSGKRRTSGLNNGSGRGRGRYHMTKISGNEAPQYATKRPWPRNGTEGVIESRTSRRNFCRAEYRVREPAALIDMEKSHYVKRQPHAESSGASGLTENKQNGVGKDAHRDTASNGSFKTFSYGSRGKVGNSEYIAQPGGRVGRFDVEAVESKSGPLTHPHMKGFLESDNAGDASLPTGVVCVFEQHGIETQNDKDDFIKVRSKRQLLREHKEQREKEKRAKVKELKAKEQLARIQCRRVPGKAGVQEHSISVPSKNSLERRSAVFRQYGSDEGKVATRAHSAGVGLKLQYSVSSAQVLPPVGPPASSLSDVSLDKISKSSKSHQVVHPSSMHMESGNRAVSAQDSWSNTPESSINTSAAWGGQRSIQQVVSLTQIQLEEAMKPLQIDGSPASQKLPLSARATSALEPDLTLPSRLVLQKVAVPLSASSIELENATTPVISAVSIPGPISSLLAGEKIQFGGVTSPTLISPTSSHPPSTPIPRIGSPLGFRSDMSHIYSSRTSNYLGTGGDATFTSEGTYGAGRAAIEDAHRQAAVDAEKAEAEAEAAASAVAVAAIGHDDSSAGNHHVATRAGAVLRRVADGDASTVGGGCYDPTANYSGASETRASVQLTSNRASSVDDLISVTLPADLSVETPSSLLQGSSTNIRPSSGLLLQSLPSGASPFPCLDMGTMLGGPIFTFGPREDAPLASLEPGLANLGSGGIAGWRHLSNTESFFGAPPSGFTAPFVTPTGIPGIQGHPHMLVYANPFTPVGQFGQLGVSFMSTAYHPSGKQPDWKHTPLPVSSQGAQGLNDGDMNVGLTGAMPSQHSSGASSSSQLGPSVMPPPSLFNGTLPAPFQVANLEGLVQSHWSKAPAPPSNNLSLLGPSPPLNVQPRHSHTFASQLGQVPHLMDVNSGLHHLPPAMSVTNSPYMAVDAAAQFPDELGLGDSLSSNMHGFERLSSSGHASMCALSGSPLSPGSKSQRAQQLTHSNLGLTGATASNNRDSSSVARGTGGSGPELSQFQVQNLDQHRSFVHDSTSHFPNQKASQQQSLMRGNLGSDWSLPSTISSSNMIRKGTATSAGRTVPLVDRGSAGERTSAVSSKLKQIYITKPTGNPRK